MSQVLKEQLMPSFTLHGYESAVVLNGMFRVLAAMDMKYFVILSDHQLVFNLAWDIFAIISTQSTSFARNCVVCP